MRNIKLTIEYDGSRYAGWQRLGKGESENTVENKLLEIIKKMTGEDSELFCGLRTETGVHAYAQIANFKTNCALKLYEIKNYFNRYLPMDIAIIDIEEKPERFHSSLNAKSKKYLYRIAIGDVPSVFDRKYTYYSFTKLDTELMKQAASYLLGRHDFKKFSTAKKSKSTEKEVYDIDIYSDDKEIQITIHANDFIHNMARMIVGTLIDIGSGKREPDVMKTIISPDSSEEASAPANSQGMFLLEVLY